MEFKFVKVIEVTRHSTSKGREYKLITFNEYVINEHSKIKPTGRKGKRTFWPPRNNIRVFYVQTQKTDITNWKGDIDYENIWPGYKVCGEIIEFRTTPYHLDNEKKETFNSVIFEGERDQIRETARQMLFMNLEAYPLDESGTPYIYQPKIIEIDDWPDE